MEKRVPLPVSVPASVKRWVQDEAGRRKMNVSEFTMHLITTGIRGDRTDEMVTRLERAIEKAGITREVLRQTLATRYIVEQQAKGGIKNPTTLGFDANQYADRELERIWPKENQE